MRIFGKKSSQLREAPPSNLCLSPAPRDKQRFEGTTLSCSFLKLNAFYSAQKITK